MADELTKYRKETVGELYNLFNKLVVEERNSVARYIKLKDLLDYLPTTKEVQSIVKKVLDEKVSHQKAIEERRGRLIGKYPEAIRWQKC